MWGESPVQNANVKTHGSMKIYVNCPINEIQFVNILIGVEKSETNSLDPGRKFFDLHECSSAGLAARLGREYIS